MKSPMDDASANGRDSARWQRFGGKRVDLSVLTGSPLVSSGEALAQRADRVVAVLEEMLEPDRSDIPDQLFLRIIPPGDHATVSGQVDGDQDRGPRVIVADVEDAAQAIVAPITRALIARWYGPTATEAGIIVDGLVGVLVERIEGDSETSDADRRAREAVEEGRWLSIFPLERSAQDGPTRAAVATSFVSYLINTYGSQSLGAFLRAFEPDRTDAAAHAVYFQPLGALEQAWFESLHRQPRTGSAFRTLGSHLMPLIRPHRVRAAEYLVLMLVGVGLTIAAPLTIMWIVDHILPHAHGHYDDLALFVGLLLVIFLLDAGIMARRTFLQQSLGEQVMMTLHGRVFEHLLRLSHNYYSRTTTSNLMSLLNEDLREIRAAMIMVTGSAFYQVLLALATAITLLVLDPLLGLISMVIVPVFALGYRTLRARWQREAQALQRLQGEADHLAHENLSAHAEIKAYGLQEATVDAYHRRHRLMLSRHLRLTNLGAGFESSLHLASGLGYVVVFGFGGYQVISEQGGVTIGVLFAFAHLLPLIYEPIERLADLGHTVEGAAGAFDRLDTVLEEPLRITDAPNATDFPPLSEAVQLDHVTFGYDSGQPVLKDLDLTIPAGADVAIVGPSGSGKSTIINLLMRFWDPDGGRVLFDGRDLREGTVASLRDQIGIVFPETFTFNTSVRENIAMGHPDATDDEIERAAREAQLDDFIRSLPAGYHTVLGEHGVRMSSGQRQRLAIARALLRDPRVLILDEATSNIDPQTESEILDMLGTIGHGRTVISVRHRMAAVAPADIIFVLDGGRLVEQGKHAELVKAGGLYQRMYEEQMLYLHGGGVVRIGVDVNRLRLIPIFADLGAEELQAVADRFMLERFAADQVVVRQGDPGDKLYLISRGEMEVIAEGPPRRHINTINRGDFFGEAALLTGEPRNATVQTVGPTQLYSLSSDDFLPLLDRFPRIRETVDNTLRERQTHRDRLGDASVSSPDGSV